MNQIVNKYLLTGGRFMPEMHLKHIVLVDHLLETNKTSTTYANRRYKLYLQE